MTGAFGPLDDGYGQGGPDTAAPAAEHPEPEEADGTLPRFLPGSGGDGDGVTLGPLLGLSPAHLERSFWRSNVFEEAAQTADAVGACLLAMASSVHAMWLLLLRNQSYTLQLWQCFCLLAVSAVQLACIRSSSGHRQHGSSRYLHWRNSLVLFNRVLLFGFTLVAAFSLRALAFQAAPPTTSLAAAFTSTTSMPAAPALPTTTAATPVAMPAASMPTIPSDATAPASKPATLSSQPQQQASQPTASSSGSSHADAPHHPTPTTPSPDTAEAPPHSSLVTAATATNSLPTSTAAAASTAAATTSPPASTTTSPDAAEVPPPTSTATAASVITVLVRVAFLSGSGAALIHAIALLLPLRQQVVVQTLHVGVLLGLQLSPVCRLLLEAIDVPTATSICHSLNWVLDVVALSWMGASPGKAKLDQRCEGGGAVVLLVVLLDLYLGLMLPLYITYKVEQRRKLAFVEDLRWRDSDSEDALPVRNLEMMPALQHLQLLFFMAAQAWVLALVAIKHLPPELYTLQLPPPAA